MGQNAAPGEIRIPHHDEVRVLQRLRLVVAQRLQRQAEDATTGRLDDALGGGGVPLAGGAEPHVAVGRPFRHQTGLEGAGAERDQLVVDGRVEAAGQVLQLLAAADGHHQRIGLIVLVVHGTDGVHLAVRLLEGAMTAYRPVEHVRFGGIDDAEHRHIVLHQGDQGGEVTAAGDELAGAVEGIHQPVLTPVGAQTEGNVGRLFGQHGHVGSERRQRLFEVGIGSKIGTGDRGRILLQLTLELTAVIDFVKDPARFARDLLDPRHPGQQLLHLVILCIQTARLRATLPAPPASVGPAAAH